MSLWSGESHRDRSRYAPSQWETSIQCNNISHWLGSYLDWSPVTEIFFVFWWCHDMETVSELLVLCERNSPVTGGFLSQWATNAKCWCFIYHWPKPAVDTNIQVANDGRYNGVHVTSLELRHISSCYASTFRHWGLFKNVYELLNLRALKISILYKNHIFQCNIVWNFCVEFKIPPWRHC